VARKKRADLRQTQGKVRETKKPPGKEGISRDSGRGDDWRPTWEVQTDLRAFCPVCGWRAKVSLMKNGPYKPVLYLQKYGGKRPDGKGYMEFEELPEEEQREFRKTLKNILLNALAALEKIEN